MQWTASGDGLIAAGILEVVLWKKKNKIWEVAWKTRTEAPQTLVAATWTIEGPAATAARAFNHPGGQHFDQSSLPREASRCVLIYHGDGKSGFVKLELCHPQPVTMIDPVEAINCNSIKELRFTFKKGGAAHMLLRWNREIVV